MKIAMKYYNCYDHGIRLQFEMQRGLEMTTVIYKDQLPIDMAISLVKGEDLWLHVKDIEGTLGWNMQLTLGVATE